jgi:hypothetical protein
MKLLFRPGIDLTSIGLQPGQNAVTQSVARSREETNVAGRKEGNKGSVTRR